MLSHLHSETDPCYKEKGTGNISFTVFLFISEVHMRTLVTLMAVALCSASLVFADTEDPPPPPEDNTMVAAALPPTGKPMSGTCHAFNSQGEKFRAASAELVMNACMINTPPGEVCHFDGCS